MALHFFPEPESDEIEIRRKTRQFADEEIRPTAISDDENCHFRVELFRKLGKLGLVGVSLPKEFGGAGQSYRCYYAALEEIGRASVALSVSTGVTNLVQGAIVKFGTDLQKKDYLPKLASADWLGAFSLSEPQSGSDAAALRCSAKRVEGGYVLNGNKVWCSNAGFADLYLIMTRTSPDRTKGITAFLVEKNAEGFRIGKQEKKLGLRASTLAELIFEDCFLPDAARIGAEGEGFKVALSQLDNGRIAIGTAGVAIAVEALERGMKFNGMQKRAGVPVVALGECLAEYYAQASALRTFVMQTAKLRDQGKTITVPASQIKLLGSELAVKVTNDVILGMGEAGVLRENEVERLLRDAKALQIVEGTNQVQRIVLAREMEEMSA